MPPKANPPSPAAVLRFWQWFTANDERLFHFEQDLKPTFAVLTTAMNEVDPDLTFEFGPVQDGQREFVISAGGIKRAFDAVRRLADASPAMPRWRVVAFRPRRALRNVVELDGIRVDPATVQYSLLTSKTEVGLHLFIPGYDEEDSRYGQAGYLLLDEALGEYDVETKVGMIEMFAPETQTGGPRYSMSELPDHLDGVFRRLTAGA